MGVVLLKDRLKAWPCLSHCYLFQVDPSLLGGMVVEIGDKRVDMSIASRIKGLCNLLRESV